MYKYTLLKYSAEGDYSIALHYVKKTDALKSMFDAVNRGFRVMIMLYDVWRGQNETI